MTEEEVFTSLTDLKTGQKNVTDLIKPTTVITTKKSLTSQ